MKVGLIAPNKYSERALAVYMQLMRTGFKPDCCACLATVDWRQLVRKVAQYGPHRFASYAWRRVAGGGPQGGVERIQNPYLRELIATDHRKSKDLKAVCHHYGTAFQRIDDLNGAVAASFFSQRKVDLIVYTGGGILRSPLLNSARLGVINAHAGILPEYRGMSVIAWALLNGEPDKVGVTVHFVDEGVDTGRIILTRPVAPVASSILDLQERVSAETVHALVDAVRSLSAKNRTARYQNAADGKQYFVMHEALQAIAQERFSEQPG